MNADRLRVAIATLVGDALAREFVDDFLTIRQDLATRTLGRASPGKFVESFVQCLQQISRGSHDPKPDVDDYLSKRVENATSLPEGLRVCAARVATAIYTLRNKRSIAHKGQVDPNTIDLSICHHQSAWIMAELLRSATGVKMEEAGELIALVQAPVGTLVEDFGDVRLVLADVSVRVELLILLHSYYPSPVKLNEAQRSLCRLGASTVKNRLRDLFNEKLLHGTPAGGYVLTQNGYAAALEERRKPGASLDPLMAA